MHKLDSLQASASRVLHDSVSLRTVSFMLAETCSDILRGILRRGDILRKFQYTYIKNLYLFQQDRISFNKWSKNGIHQCLSMLKVIQHSKSSYMLHIQLGTSGGCCAVATRIPADSYRKNCKNSHYDNNEYHYLIIHLCIYTFSNITVIPFETDTAAMVHM